MRNELEELEKRKRFKFKLVLYTYKPEECWKGLCGFLDKEMIKDTLPTPSDSTMILICGSEKMSIGALKLLKDLKYDDNHVYEF